MVSLLDIGPAKGTETIRGVELEVTGISARGLFQLLEQFPELRRLFGGVDVRPEQLFEQAPHAIDCILCKVLGIETDERKPGFDIAKVAAVGDNLVLGEQLAIVKKAWDLTFPRGVTSFFEALEAMGVGGESIKAPPIMSQERSKSSLPQDTDQTMSGGTPLDNSAAIVS